MKKFIIIVVVVLLGGFVHAQSSTLNKKEQRTLLRETKKKEAAEKKEKQYQMISSMVKEGRFVLEADMLFNRYGENMQVQSSINFVLCDSLRGVIQVGNDSQIGRNGVGGVTVEGDVTDYIIKENEKKHSITVRYDLRTPFGTYNVFLNTLGGGRSEATVSGIFSSGSIRFSGRLIPLSKSKVYKGSSF